MHEEFVMAKPLRSHRWWAMAICLMTLGSAGCLGPNPLFFIGSTAAGAAIQTIVSSLVSDALQLGGN